MSVTISAGPNDTDDSLNLANGNFCRLMALLGVEFDYPEDLDGVYSGDELRAFRAAVTDMLDAVTSTPHVFDAGRPSIESIRPPGARFVDGGTAPGYYHRRLTQLLAVIDRALLNGQPLRFT